MLSSWQLWDFFQSYPQNSWQEFKNPIGLLAFDSLSLRWMREHIFKGMGREQRPQVLIGAEVELEFLKNELSHLDLFGEVKKFIILHPEELKNDCKKFLLDWEFDGSEPLMILAFHQESAFQKKWSQKAQMIQIEAPRFWENQKLIDFLASFFKLQMTLEAKNLILDCIEPQLMSLAPVLRNIKLLIPEPRLIQAHEIVSYVEQSRFDQFQLATLLGKKKFNDFFEKLISLPFDYGKYRSVFNFLTHHFIRVYDPSYLSEKKRLSQYDKEIQHISQAWDKNELESLLNFLVRCEIACKLKAELFYEQIIALSFNIQAYHLNPSQWAVAMSEE